MVCTLAHLNYVGLDSIRWLIDFGFVVLIWAVQLVIYPSFKYYSKENLFVWHKRYTLRVTYVVLPLMLTQLVLVCIQLYQTQNWYTVSSAVIIFVLWLQTFLVFVPLHQSIDANQPKLNVCDQLIQKNWWRTVLWSALFVISSIYIFLI